MKVEVKLFARARDLAGAPQVTLELPEPGSVRDLRNALATDFPQLSPLVPNLLIAVNSEYVSDIDSLTDGAEIACFPPVSGG
jgi:molybdopterin converting factor subunit 1